MPTSKAGPAGLGMYCLLGLCTSGTVSPLEVNDLIVLGNRYETIKNDVAETIAPSTKRLIQKYGFIIVCDHYANKY